MKTILFTVGIFAFLFFAGCSTTQSAQSVQKEHSPGDIIQAEFTAKDEESQAFIVLTLKVFQPNHIYSIEGKNSEKFTIFAKGQRGPIEHTAKLMLQIGYATNVKITE